MRLLLAIAALLQIAAFAADDAESKAFTMRVEQYVKIRKAAINKSPPLSKTAKPEEIVKYENALAATIRLARLNAKEGDLFTPEVKPMFLAILKRNLDGSANQSHREIARQGNPPRDAESVEAQPVIQVNAIYPKSAPVSSMPPLLLKQLPALPKDIEYRFVGNTLILYDSLSNLIIDYLKGAAPAL
jgi:hypothetical protein